MATPEADCGVVAGDDGPLTEVAIADVEPQGVVLPSSSQLHHSIVMTSVSVTVISTGLVVIWPDEAPFEIVIVESDVIV